MKDHADNRGKGDLPMNLDRLHTTDLGVERIKKNLSLDAAIDVVGWCRDIMKDPNSEWVRRGKNWYIQTDDCIITVNAFSDTIITAHKRKKQ